MTVEVRLNGLRFSGFSRGSLMLSMEQVYGTFDCEYVASSKLPGERVIYKGDYLEWFVDGELALAGFADEVTEDDQPNDLILGAIGRSVTLDLDDCSAEHLGFSNVSIGDVVTALLKPYPKIGLEIVGDPGARFPSFQVQRGETCVDAIWRLCSKRGLFPYCVGRNLVLARAGSIRTRTVLERGKNARQWRRSDSLQQRYSHYVFRGQIPASDHLWGAKANQLKHAITDPGVPRYRPLSLHVDTHGPGDLRARAEMERNQRAGRSENIVCTVSGHQTDEGYLWRPNLLARARNPVIGLNATLLVVSTRMRFGENEDEDTELTLTRPEGFDRVNYPATTRGNTWT